MLALDIDGTLINKKMEVTRSTRRAIEAAQRQGALVTLATGRSFHSAKHYADQLKIDIPLICANGACIRHRNGESFMESALPENTESLIREMTEAGAYIQAYHRDGIYTTGNRTGLLNWVKIICDNRIRLGHLLYSINEVKRSNLKHCPDLAELVSQGEVVVHKLFCAGSLGQLEDFKDRALARGLSVEHYPGNSGSMYLEIMPAGASKGTALDWLAEHLNIAMNEVVAVGDNLNDLAMIKAAGLGVAMGNGHSQLKAQAGHVTLSNEDDGIAAVIREFVLTPDKTRKII